MRATKASPPLADGIWGRIVLCPFPGAMRTCDNKAVLTTGEVARICHVAPRTVSKWFDTGRLCGYRIPGSRDRRIPRAGLLAFMRAHGIPTEAMEDGRCRVLIVDEDIPRELEETLAASGRYEVRSARNGFEAGVAAHQFRPHVILLAVGADPSEAAAVCRNIKVIAELNAARVIAAAAGLGPDKQQRLMSLGFDACLAKPCSAAALTAAVEEVTSLFR